MSDSLINLDVNRTLTDYCRNATNVDGDTFVGIKSEYIDDKHNLSINFPIGYKISKDEELVREDIIQLVLILQEYNDEKSRVGKIMPESHLKTVRFPVQAYYTVMFEFLNNGYYQINEEQYRRGTSGSVNWNRTIKQERPIPQENGFLYPQYRVKHHNETDKDLITEINRYCVFQSFLRLGWIYKLQLPQKPVRKRSHSFYKEYLTSFLLRTNRDKDKRLFQAMIDILNYESDENDAENLYFGTYNFEYIWENMIEDTFGNERKEKYFPKTRWLLNMGTDRKNTALEPDTVMRYENSIYVLDAKYYKYGITNSSKDLPNSSSINKQISYGEFIATNKKFENERQDGLTIYNAFLMPYDASSQLYNKNQSDYYSIGEAIADWKNSNEEYQRVQGILIDTKFLMFNTLKPNTSEIKQLSEEIIRSIENN